MKRKHTKILSVLLAAVMLFSTAVMAFADESDFDYYFANDAQTEIYIAFFNGTIPENGYVEIPETIDGFTVVGIASHAFYYLSALRGVVVLETVDIDENAFYGCGNVDIIRYSNDVDEPKDDDFDASDWYEDHQQDYVINGTTLVEYIGSDEIVVIPYICTEISENAFRGNETITTVYFEKNMKTIGENAFAGCSSLENIIPGSGTDTLNIGAGAFDGTPWLENYPSTFAILGSTLVKYKGNESVVSVPNVVTAIAAGAFAIGDETTDIAFRVRVPFSVEVFGEDCFYLYTSVDKVYPDIVVYSGSAAEEYCKAQGLEFSYAAMLGDVNRDGRVTAADARFILRVSARLEGPITDDEIKEAADVTADGKILANDARLVLRISAGLEDYSPKKMASMPRTDYEVLLTAARALSLTRAYGCSYSKIEYQEVKDVKMNSAIRSTYFAQFERQLTSPDKAQTFTYEQNSQEAYDNLFDITLIDSSKIESYSCTIDDNSYNIMIVLKDEKINGKEVDTVSYTEKMFPVKTVAGFTGDIKGKYWYNEDNLDYNVTYNGCTLEMKADVNSLQLQSLILTMNYDFEITGKILGIAVRSGVVPATATRTDTVRYTNFIYS